MQKVTKYLCSMDPLRLVFKGGKGCLLGLPTTASDMCLLLMDSSVFSVVPGVSLDLCLPSPLKDKYKV